MHAALSDPARLTIVDTLMVGDAAPGELGVALDLPTNLVAHHLKVLQQAGLIARTRSEGDRRRTYVRLVPEAHVVISSPVLQPAPRIVFVCTHNSARSQLAAAIWHQHSQIPAVSAGTDPADRVHPRAVRVGRRHGLHLTQAGTTHVRDVLRHTDLVIAVCDNAHEHLATHLASHLAPGRSQQRRQLHWSVPDPAPADTDRAFEAAYTDIAARIDRLAPSLSNTAKGNLS